MLLLPLPFVPLLLAVARSSLAGVLYGDGDEDVPVKVEFVVADDDSCCCCL